MNSLRDSVLESRILVVDDEPANVQLVERFLEFAGYVNVRSTSNSSIVLETIRTYSPDIVLLDLHMPKPDGYEILAMLDEKENQGRYLPVLVFTADGTPEARKKALEAGASDFLTKPGDAQEILLRVRNFLLSRRMHIALQRQNEDLEERVHVRTAQLSLARQEAIEALARAAEYRDDDTGQHTKRVGELSAEIAKALGESRDFVEAIRYAAPLHDVGKIGLPDSILLKPGPLTDEEVQVMRRHTITGAQVFRGIESPLMELARDIALCHHERWDGGGYPRGISGEAIPLAARIVSVADVFDALTHARPYKTAWPTFKAIDEIEGQAGMQFDPQVVSAFIKVVAPNRQISQAA